MMHISVLIQSKPLELMYAGLDPPSLSIQRNWCTLVSPRASEDPRQATPSVCPAGAVAALQVIKLSLLGLAVNSLFNIIILAFVCVCIVYRVSL